MLGLELEVACKDPAQIIGTLAQPALDFLVRDAQHPHGRAKDIDQPLDFGIHYAAILHPVSGKVGVSKHVETTATAAAGPRNFAIPLGRVAGTKYKRGTRIFPSEGYPFSYSL